MTANFIPEVGDKTKGVCDVVSDCQRYEVRLAFVES